ncbi:MAG: 4-hydroxy-3-methylbut-2-enyl diphosphate reductase [Verrucomicrobia bacterium]|nr:4-hydroxy-3-methylbut-2-enyl diphosphate reductase [Verrucomicrobiota bacterium]
MSGFEIEMAGAYGMCFGVRDAVAAVEELAGREAVTVLGELVHNEVVLDRMKRLGAQTGSLGAPGAGTREVVVTAHGASDADKERWAGRGHRVTDTTCPLVRKAHTALAQLVAGGCAPVVIGKAGHVEVNGLVGDFPGARVVLSEREVEALPFAAKIGVVSQTTQPIERVEALVAALRRRHPEAEVIFKDTVCQPTKRRQEAMDQLCVRVEFVLVVGGANSNNSWQLVEKARRLGCRAERVARPEEVKEHWFYGCRTVGVTAGTSTLREAVEEVVGRLEEIGGRRRGAVAGRKSEVAGSEVGKEVAA